MRIKIHRNMFRVGMAMYEYGIIVKFPFRRRICVYGKRIQY